MMKIGCTSTKKAVKESSQHPGNQQVRFQDKRQLTKKCFSASGCITMVKTINSTIYSNMLIKVSDAIREKRKKEFRKKVVLFHQDNAQ
ncbi:UNVERIFIED_CONTAM: hypothetical protein NCL1_19845 [Trichonephila clavipes]